MTALIKEDDGLTQVMLRVASDKSHGLNGFLSETVAELRHVVGTVQSAQETGVVKNEQVINIIDSVVQKTSFGGNGGEGSASVNIQDSVVQRTEFNAGEDKTVEEERLRREREKQRKEEEEQHRKQEEERKTKVKQEQLEREQEVAREENEQRKAREALILKQRDEHQKPTQKSRKNVFMFAIVLGALLVGFTMFPPESNDIPAPSQTSMPSQSYIQTAIVSQDSIQQTIDSLEFVLIPAGEFDMGSPLNEAGRSDNEGPVHHVEISKAFYMSKYEVTQKQWRDVMGRSFNGDNLPVETVSWNDVQNFIKKLNDKEGGNKYRLPTEAE